MTVISSSNDNNHLTFVPFRRSREESILRQALGDASTGNGRTQVVLVRGPSGVGKSVLVATALSSFARDDSYWAGTAKASSSTTPFAPLRQLLTQICHSLLASPPSVLERTRAELVCGLDRTQQKLLMSVVPVLGDILGGGGIMDESCATIGSASDNPGCGIVVDSSLRSEDDQIDIRQNGLNNLKIAVRGFFRAVCAVRPTVLCLDDIMWACEQTLYVLLALLTDETVGPLLFCATAREDTSCKHWKEWQTKLEERLPPSSIRTIALTNLSLQEVSRLVLDSIHLGKKKRLSVFCNSQNHLVNSSTEEEECKEDILDNSSLHREQQSHQVQELARVFFEHTQGNIFFMTQLLDNLQATGAIYKDCHRNRWDWKLNQIERCNSSLTDAERVIRVVSSMVQRLQPPCLVSILQLASCLGNTRFTLQAVEACQSVLGITCGGQSMQDCLRVLCHQEFLVPLDDDDNQYKFAHDTIQIAAHQLLKEELSSLEKIHWEIGSHLLQLQPRSDQAIQDQWLFFTCVDQLNLGAPKYAQSEYDRQKVAHMNLRAGKRAATMSAFHPASLYFKAGVEVLGHEAFAEVYYKLSVELHTLYAKTEHCIGHIEESQRLANLVVQNCRSAAEKEAPYLTLIHCYWAADRQCAMIDVCLDLLQTLGEKLPNKPGELQFWLEYQKLTLLLRGKNDNFFLTLPTMKYDAKALAIRVLCEMVMQLHHHGRTKLLLFVISRMAHITVKYGLSKFTPEAIACIGAFLSSRGLIEDGFRFGSLAETFLGRSPFNQRELKGRCFVYIAACTKWWAKPLPLSLDLFIKGNEYCMASGCPTFVGHCHILYSIYFFYSGLPLLPLLKDVESFCNLFLEYHQYPAYQVLTPLWQCLLNLCGESKDPGNMETGLVIERRKLITNNSNNGKQIIQSYWMQIAFYMGDMEKASELANQLKSESVGLTKAFVYFAARLFTFSLIAVADYRRSSKGGKCKKYLAEVKGNIKTFQKLVRAGAVNVLHKLQILEAELWSVTSTKSVERIRRKYDEAIVAAQRAGFLQDAALANYLCFQFCTSKSEPAENYLKRSHSLYKTWNACALADSLVERHGQYFGTVSSDAMGHGFHRSREVFNSSLSEQHKFLPV